MATLLGRWNQARWGTRQRGASGWWRGRTRLVYVHLTDDEWAGAGEAARVEGRTREQWLVGLCQRALACPSVAVLAEQAADDAAARRRQARRRTGADR